MQTQRDTPPTPGKRIALPSVYLDACCLNRPFDDQCQERIRLESEAIYLVFRRIRARQAVWIGSDVLDYELRNTADESRRRRLLLLARWISSSQPLQPSIVQRAESLEVLGFKDVDALHLASAEAARVDVFLTTDDRLLRRARRHQSALAPRVVNPLNWISGDDAP